MFRREIRTASLAGLSREIQARRERVHYVVEREMAGESPRRSPSETSRIFRVLAAFQEDMGIEEAQYLGR
jgi:hypothetical protein